MATRKTTSDAKTEQQSLEREFRIEAQPIRKVLADQRGLLDSNVMINADPMSSRYPSLQKRLEEFIRRVSGEDVFIGFFNYDDLARVSQLGYYVLSTGTFDAGQWTNAVERELGVWVDATSAVRIDNKYVCFILRDLREQRLVKAWEASSDRLAAAARREAGSDKPISQVKPGEVSADFDDQLETVQHQTRKRQEQPTEAEAPQ